MNVLPLLSCAPLPAPDPSKNPPFTPAKATTTSVRLPELDGLRGIAIGLVLTVHLISNQLNFDPAIWWMRVLRGFRFGWCGVDLFFVLSGFLIGGILLDHRESPRLIRVFFVRRALRILPLFYVTLAIIYLRPTHLPANILSWPVQALFVSNIAQAFVLHTNWPPLNVTWSLAVEEQFYLVAPWIMLLCLPRRLPWLLLGVWISSWFARVGVCVAYHDLPFGLYTLTPLRIDGLALGWLAAWLLRTPPHHPMRLWFLRHGQALLFATSAAGFVFFCFDPEFLSVATACFGFASLAACFATLTLVVVLIRPEKLNCMLRSRILGHLGRHAYFIYLWHELVFYGLQRYFPVLAPRIDSLSSLLMVAVPVALTWLLATVSWRYFEAPLIRLGHRFAF